MKDEIICYCSEVTKSQILEAIQNGAKKLQDIRQMTKACTISNCKEMNPKRCCCYGDITKILQENKG